VSGSAEGEEDQPKEGSYLNFEDSYDVASCTLEALR